MTDVNIQAVEHPEFAGHAAFEDRALRVQLSGSADARATAALDTFVNQVHAEATRLGLSEVVVDVTQLRFMNSSCFKTFMSWITNVGALAAGARYKLRFAWAEQVYWQRRGLDALKAFGARSSSCDQCSPSGFFRFCCASRKRSAQPSLTICFTRESASAPRGTSLVTVVPDAT